MKKKHSEDDTTKERENLDHSSGKKIPHTSEPHEEEQGDCSI